MKQKPYCSCVLCLGHIRAHLSTLCVQAQLRELQQVAEDLQIKLEEHRRRKHKADRLKEQTLKALQTGDNGKCRAVFNLT